MDASFEARLDSARDHSISDAFVRQRARLRTFIHKRVANPADAEDILQDVFYELVEAARLVRPIEQVGAWLFTVARNRITDLFRKKKTESIEPADEDEDCLQDMLPAADGGPEAEYARQLLLEELDAALDELPIEQSSVFIAHELDGRSFKQLAADTGIAMNTLLARKRYAVLHLRRRLQAIHDEFIQT
jgi:RNA polymerase sigma factor (sigma-70 family)